MAIIRWVLGRIILLADMLYRPRGIPRSPQEQLLMDKQTSNLSLYQYSACPFCVKVRWAMRRYSLNVEARNAKENPAYGEELLAGGGFLKVPCLRIDHGNNDIEWLYESSDIITYLEQHFQLVEKQVASAS